jgi:hypothetical protein
VEVSESACDEQLEEPDVDGNVDPHCRLALQAEGQECIRVRALPGVSVSPV